MRDFWDTAISAKIKIQEGNCHAQNWAKSIPESGNHYCRHSNSEKPRPTWEIRKWPVCSEVMGKEEKDTDRQAQAEFEYFVSRAKSVNLLQVG